MNSVHDMGGLQCFGPVQPEPHEPLFHAPWERQAMALTVAMGATGQWNIDQMRSARESLPPAQYLGMSYYQIWLKALQDMKVTPHVAQNVSGRTSAIDRRTTRHDGYRHSQRIRKRIEEGFGWIKTIAGQQKTKFRGRERVGFAFTFAAAAYNLVRLPKLLATA